MTIKQISKITDLEESLKTNYSVSKEYFKDTIETYTIEDVVWHEKYRSSILIASAILIDVVPIVILLIFIYYRSETEQDKETLEIN